jgi:hypothetical protein
VYCIVYGANSKDSIKAGHSLPDLIWPKAHKQYFAEEQLGDFFFADSLILQTVNNLTLIRMTKDEKVLAFFKSLLL